MHFPDGPTTVLLRRCTSKGGVAAPQPMPLPTFLVISQTSFPPTTTPDTTKIASSNPQTSAEKTSNRQPTDFLVGELIVLLIAVEVVLIIFGT